jgi:hypothetical protein
MGWARENIPGYKQIVDPIVQFAKGIASVFTGSFGVDFDAPDYSSSQSESIQGVLVNKDSAIANIPVVYGTRAVGGIRVFVSTGSGSNEYLYVAYVLSEGQVNGYTSLLIDDNTVSIANRAHGVRSVATSGNYATESRLEVQFFDGRDDQVASSLLKEAPGWTDDHKLSGLAYIACKFRWKKVENETDANNNPYGGGVPRLVAVLEGKKIFDVVSGYSPENYGGITGRLSGSPSSVLTFNVGNTYLTASQSISGENTANYTDTFEFTLVRETTLKLLSELTFTRGLNTSQVFSISDVFGTFTNTGDITITNLSTTAAQSFYYPSKVSEQRPSINLQVEPPRTVTPGPANETQLSVIDQNVTLPAGTYSIRFNVILTERNAGASNFTGQLNHSFKFDTQTPVDHVISYDNDTKVFSDNPVNVLLDYMRNDRYGKGLGNESIDWLSFRTAATLCNQVVNYTDSTSGKAFTCNVVMDTGETLMDNIKMLLVGFRGIMPYQQGRYVLKIEHGGDDSDITATPLTPPVTFVATNDEILGGISIAGDSKRTKINRCKVTYVDPYADYQPNEVVYPEDGSADDLAYLAEDGVRLEKDVTLNMITSREQALQAAEVFVKRSRNFKQVSLVTNMAGSNVTVGDLFRVINDRLGLDGVFRVVEIAINEEGNIEISGFEHQSSAYSINAKDADIIRPTLSLPDPNLVVAPTGVTATSGAAQNIATGGGYLDTDSTLRRIQVDWTATADPFVRDYIVEYKLSADSTYDTAGITTRNQFHIGPVTLGAVYNIRVAARNELDRRSNFASASPHTVIE